MQQNIFPALATFAPHMLVVSAGFDGHKMDKVSHAMLDDQDYFFVSQQLQLIADRCCHGPLVWVLEGGYNLNSALASSVAAHTSALMSSSIRDNSVIRQGLHEEPWLAPNIDSKRRGEAQEEWEALAERRA